MEKLYRAEKAKFLGLKSLGLGGPPGSALEMPLVNPGQQLKKSLVRQQCSLAIGQRASVNEKSAMVRYCCLRYFQLKISNFQINQKWNI